MSPDQPYEFGALPDLFEKKKGKDHIIQDKLNNYRNTFTFLANLVVLTFGLFVFFFMTDREKEYKIIALLVLGIGFISSLFFLLQVK